MYRVSCSVACIVYRGPGVSRNRRVSPGVGNGLAGGLRAGLLSAVSGVDGK